jgi:E3 ubiquitin-protein ligase UBR7
MHPLPVSGGSHEATEPDNSKNDVPSSRRDSMSQKSEDSQTAADFIRDQLQLEADAREALPYVCDFRVFLTYL